MKKHALKQKPVARKSIFTTARGALVHVVVFGVISMAGHVATLTLSASVGSAGTSLVAPIAGMHFF